MYPWMVSTRGSGPRVVLVHGSVSNGSSWSSQAPLAESVELVVPDRGGYWPNPPRGGTPFPQQAAELAELIEPGTHLVGHSYGGVIAILAAALRVDDVTSLTVLEPPLLHVARGVPAVDELVGGLTALFDDAPDELRELGEHTRCERVANLGAAALRHGQARVAQDAQVLGDGRLRDPEDVGEVARTGTRVLREAEDDAEPHRMAERLEARGGFGVARGDSGAHAP
jgi:pimeloyl-ACP methyl ester carboxylesterase